MKKILRMVVIFTLSIGVVIGIYSLVFVMTYDEYKKENFQRGIVESLGVDNEERNFIMVSVKIEDYPVFDMTILSWSNGIRSTICDETKNGIHFFHFENGEISIKKIGEEEVKKNGNREEFLNEVFLMDIDWSKSTYNAKVNSLTLAKNKNSLTVNFVFKKDYKLALQIPSLGKTFIIENINISYQMRLTDSEDKGYTWPAFFQVEGEVDGKKIIIDYMQ